MHIEQRGALTVLSDLRVTLGTAYLLGLAVLGVFGTYAIHEVRTNFALREPDLTGVFIAGVGIVLVVLLAGAFIFAPHTTATIDHRRRILTFERKRLLMPPTVATIMKLDDIVCVSIDGSWSEADNFITISCRTAPPVQLSRFGQSRARAEEVAAVIEAARQALATSSALELAVPSTPL
jgi:hypothetical protein